MAMNHKRPGPRRVGKWARKNGKKFRFVRGHELVRFWYMNDSIWHQGTIRQFKSGFIFHVVPVCTIKRNGDVVHRSQDGVLDISGQFLDSTHRTRCTNGGTLGCIFIGLTSLTYFVHIITLQGRQVFVTVVRVLCVQSTAMDISSSSGDPPLRLEIARGTGLLIPHRVCPGPSFGTEMTLGAAVPQKWIFTIFVSGGNVIAYFCFESPIVIGQTSVKSVERGLHQPFVPLASLAHFVQTILHFVRPDTILVWEDYLTIFFVPRVKSVVAVGIGSWYVMMESISNGMPHGPIFAFAVLNSGDIAMSVHVCLCLFKIVVGGKGNWRPICFALWHFS